MTHSLSSSLMCVFMYLQINVGCTSESSSAHPVRLEFSRDFGATWHLLVPLCAGAPQPSALCSTELHPASIYFPGTTQGWRREVINFGKLRLCGYVWLYPVQLMHSEKQEEIFRRKLFKLYNLSKILYLCISVFISVSNLCFLPSL